MSVTSHAVAAAILVPSIFAVRGMPQQADRTTPAMTCREWLLGTVTDSLDANDRARSELASPEQVRARQADLRAYLKKAMRAKRYCCYQFAHHNMGRVLVLKGRYEEAMRSFKKALAYDPDYEPSKQALRVLRERRVLP